MQPLPRIPRRPVVGLALLAVLLTLPSAASSQEQPTRPDRPRSYAIQNARIVTGAGPVIEGGTLVMDGGVITAVGRNVRVPAGAWVVDGEGLTVYPGLVDALSDVGLPDASPRRGPGGGGPPSRSPEGEEEDHSWGPEDRPATTPWVNAADLVDGNAEEVETWRAGGFTSAVVAPGEGLFPGQAAWMNLAGDRAGTMVVRTPVALRVDFEGARRSRGYPNSLMGVYAYVKQTFMDAAHYGQAMSIYEDSPRGLRRPAYDRTLAPILEAVRTGRPILFPAEGAVEVRRVLEMTRELEIPNPVIHDVRGGYDVAGALAARDVPVLVSADWPEAPEEADPEADFALEELRHWDLAPTTPAALHRAGVRFAFYGGDLRGPDRLLDGVRTAVDAGLPADAALRALTLTPAEIFGVADRLGTLEAGKIANVLVTEGDLFAEDTKVRMVFVDGDRFDIPEEGRGRMAEGEDEEEEEEEEEEGPRPRPGVLDVPRATVDGPYREDPVTLIRNATVMTAVNGTLEDTDILIRDGRIAEIGQGLSAPRGAHVVEAEGKWVIPGIIDAHSHIAADAINEGSVAVSAMVGIEDVLDPEDVAIYRALAGGVTMANILHGSANPIGGKNAVIKLRWGADADGLLYDRAVPGIKFALGENTKRDRDPDRYPSTRMGVQDVIRQAFLDAQAYQREWQEYEEARRAGQTVIPPRRDLKLETLVEILEGERQVHAHSYRADEILQLLRLSQEFGFRIAAFQHVLEGYKVADELAEAGAGASTFSDWWAYKVEAYDAIPHNAAIMNEKGVVVSINSDSGEEMRHLNQEAAKAIRWGGVSREDALRMVTLNPAIQLGIDEHVGSIEVGKDADLVVYDGDPLSVYGVVEQTYVDGRLFFDRELDRARREEIRREKEALIEKLMPNRRSGDRSAVTEGARVEEVIR